MRAAQDAPAITLAEHRRMTADMDHPLTWRPKHRHGEAVLSPDGVQTNSYPGAGRVGALPASGGWG